MNHYNLNKSQQEILEYIETSISKGKNIRLIDVANHCFVSTTSVINLAKKLGYNGYSELIYEYKSRYKRTPSLDNQTMVLASSIADSSGTIYIFGVDYSSILANFFVKKLAEYNIFSTTLSPRDIKIENKEGMIIFISKSGESQDLLKISENICSSYKSILLTSNVESTLASVVDYCFFIESNSNIDTDHFSSNCMRFIEEVIMNISVIKQ